MELREVFRPDWKKMIIPIILLIIYAVLVNHFFQFGAFEDKYVCQMVSLNKEYLVYRYNNQTDVRGYVLNVEKQNSLKQEIQDELSRTSVPNALFLIVETVDPLLPAPCESANQTRAYTCRYYSSKETQDCIADIAVFINGGNSSDSDQTVRPAYVNVAYGDIVANAILIFAEGYIISVVLFIAIGLSKDRFISAKDRGAKGN
jgi:hypothetical protein